MSQCLMFIIVCTLLSACGKKGPLEPLEESEYPRTYPKPSQQDSFPLKELKKKDHNDDA